jgi:hypothetical protein
MIAGRLVKVVALALVVCSTTALSAAAQITTGSMAGTVKDAQGGVIPGATVTLISETKGTRSAPIVTTETGDFLFVNVQSDTYTVEVTMPAFKMLKRTGLTVSPGNRTGIGTLTIEVGGTSEVIDVKGDSPIIQATSGERSFTVSTDAVENLPTASRSFIALALLAPGVTGTTTAVTRTGGGGDTNIMMDGVSIIDTGSNRPLLQMNVESIQEVKVLTSNYQAEYGRSSGLQITAITKSGTNRFRGSVYDVVRNSDWNANSKTNKLNGDAKPTSKESDWGFSIGGPVGKPGGSNKFFFFFAQEFEPRTGGGQVQRYRVPTALERQGDFSRTTDNLGNLYNFIKDPRITTGVCNATSQAACFADGGVLGKIPANMLYQTGLNILSMFPLPTINEVPVGQAYNFEVTRPNETILAWQPGLRLDYQAASSLRVSYKYSGWKQRSQVINGPLPGFNDTKMQRPKVSSYAFTVNYSITPTMFLEGTYGHSQNDLAGCALAQSNTGPSFCQSAIPMNPASYRGNVGLGNLPLLFPNANVFDQDYYATKALNGMNPTPPAWVNGDFQKPPQFTWGSRIGNAPPNIPFPGYFNINATQDVSISLTKVAGRHTYKMGYYQTHSYKAEQATDTNSFGTINFQQDTVGTNPFDTSFGFANAAIGTFSSYQQASKYVEGNYVYDNIEGYIQDNWKVNGKLTLDYGVRFVHQTPQYDKLGQGTNFLPDRWSISAAPQLYRPGCTIAVAPGTACPTANRQAQNPITLEFLGPNTASAFGTLVPGTGSATNGLFTGGVEIVDTTYTFPALGMAPRFGMAYDLTDSQKVVLRGGMGLFFDRPFGNSVISMAGNPPSSRLVTTRFSQLQNLGTGGLTTQGTPGLNTIQYDPKLPSSTQWNAGVQVLLPWAISADAEYVGQHSFNTVRSVNLNMIDFGTTFLPQNQDPTLAASTTPGATAYQAELLRPYRGYAGISHRLFDGWRTYHSIQLSFNRRFQNGLSFSFNDTIGLYDHQNAGARLQHAADGTYSFRADQARADELLGNNNPAAHFFRANFVWDLPDLRSDDGGVMKAIALVLNDWQLSGIWSGSRRAGADQNNSPAYTVAQSYQSGGGSSNLTGSPDYGARIIVVGDPGKGCSADPYRQFNTAAFQGPATNSDGLESGNNYLKGCFINVLDMAIARNFRLGKTRNLQVRAEMFNAPNLAGITGRNTSMTLTSPADPVNIQNLPFDAQGNLIVARSLPRGAGFGVATGYQPARTVQLQVRFSF